MSAARSNMIKRVFLFSVIAVSLVVATFALAQESNPATKSSEQTATGTGNLVDDEKIKELKEKLATKVAELRESQTRGFYGEIAALAKTSFTLVTATGEIKVRFDDNVLVFKLTGKKTEGAVKDLKNTTSAAALGLFDAEAKQQSAKVIILQNVPQFYSGKISQVDKTAATITITTEKNATLTLDYEKTTAASEFDVAEKKLKKSGLSRLSVNDAIYVWGRVSDEDSQRIEAAKIIRLPKELFAASDVKGESTASPSATPSQSPSATPKATPKATPQASS